MNDAQPFEWDASTYDALPLPHLFWGQGVLSRLVLDGDETVMDVGCGTGRDTERVIDMLPRGKVVAVDGSKQMLEQLQSRMRDRMEGVEVVHADLRKPFDYAPTVDAVFSVATFHWIPEHATLFQSIARALRPGGQLVAEAGGRGNIAAVRAALADLGVQGGGEKWNFADVDETVAGLTRAGFDHVKARLVEDPVHLERGEQLEAFLATVVLGPDLVEIPSDERGPFVRAVAERLPEATIDYVRIQVEGVRNGDDRQGTADA